MRMPDSFMPEKRMRGRENDITYREETLLLQQESRELYTQLVASNVVLGLIFTVVLGYTVGHGFWQRMKVG